jgi:hypothetical protein
MTLVVGMHLGDSVGVVGDSRVTIRHEDGRIARLDNALKVYAFPPYFIAAVAGDAFASTGFLNSFLLRLATVCSPSEYFRGATDLSWMSEHLLETYRSDIEEHLIAEDQRFACILGTENLVALEALGAVAHTLQLPWSVSEASFESSATHLAHVVGDGDKLRTLLSVKFPEGRIEQLNTGQAAYLGSGSGAAKQLRNRTTLMIPPANMSHGDRLAAAAADVSDAQRLSGDSSFNGIYFGLSLSCGALATTLHGFNRWPSDSRPKDAYEWNADNFNNIPKLIPYSAGLDLNELNTGWIYDASTMKRTKLQSYIDSEFIDAHVRGVFGLAQWLL